jgi:ABC-type polysaccharide/polyol phosphate export permease
MDQPSRRFTWLYAGSQIKLKYRYTSLGFLWNLLEPALYLGVLTLLFSVINRMSMGDYAVFLFSALVPWRYFEKVVNTSMDSIVQGDWLIKKLPVSPFALPLARWMVASVEFGFSFAVVVLLLAAVRHPWSVHLVALPAAAVAWAVAGLGAGMLAAVLFTFFRDVRPLVQLALMFGFFSAPILFKPDLFPAGTPQSTLLLWHPLSYLAALFQKPIYWAAWPSARDWAVSAAVALLCLAAGAGALWRCRARLYFHV